MEKWRRKEDQIQLTGGGVKAFMHLEPVCAALGICQRKWSIYKLRLISQNREWGPWRQLM
ncbi:hypothetical protein [Pyrobaculum sp.]|uniref:hypothetical protein n=1 Tax=Pyrobaculum sp. TaxID=2004705 RepID=UPI003D0AD7FA